MRLSKELYSLAITGVLVAAPAFAAVPNAPAPVDRAALEKSVGHALNTLAWYGVFDDLTYRVDAEGNVTLSGQVARPVVSRDAEAAVKNLAGVRHVDNRVEVLPLSPFDDNIRLRAYAAIFGSPSLSRYAINARSPIRILVKNGNVTLTGWVANDLDRKLVEFRVRGLPGTFEVTNNLRVDGRTS